jgi:hypothetical protein
MLGHHKQPRDLGNRSIVAARRRQRREARYDGEGSGGHILLKVLIDGK